MPSTSVIVSGSAAAFPLWSSWVIPFGGIAMLLGPLTLFVPEAFAKSMVWSLIQRGWKMSPRSHGEQEEQLASPQ